MSVSVSVSVSVCVVVLSSLPSRGDVDIMSVERDGLKPAAQLRGGHSDVVRCLDWDIEVPPPPLFFLEFVSLFTFHRRRRRHRHHHHRHHVIMVMTIDDDGDDDVDDVDCVVSIVELTPTTHTHTQSKSMVTGGEDSKICLWSVPIAMT